MKRVLVCAGDASGELHAAALVEELRKREPALEAFGLGGPAMQRAGVELLVQQHELAVGGLVEVLRDLRRIVGAWRRMVRALAERRPDLVVLVDSPDFNLPFAARAQRRGVPVLYYVSPQVWAWRRGRIGKIARRVDRLAVIFPFEKQVYAESGLRVDFVGHPLVERLEPFAASHPRDACRRALGVAVDRPLVALLPGSRRNEIRDTLPVHLAAAAAIHARDPRVAFVLAVAPSVAPESVAAGIAAARLPRLLDLKVVEQRTYEAVCAADVALAKPGTITVEVALLGTPLVVAARANPLTAALMRRLVKVPSFTMPNLIRGDRCVPEFLQDEARPEAVADAVLALLEGPAREAQRRALADVRARLGQPGGAARVAAIAAEMVDEAGRA